MPLSKQTSRRRAGLKTHLRVSPDKGRDLSTVERTEFRQFGDQGPGDCLSDSDIVGDAVAGERPKNLWAAEPVRERVSSPAVPSNPNSRLGRLRSPFAQGWDQMDAMVIGIDVSKDRLDVAVRPTGESLIFKRTGMGIEDPDASRSKGRPSGPPKSKFLNIGNFVREFLVINPKCDKFPENHFSVTKICPLKTFQAVFFYGGQISLRT
jgi:hypothetical protein